MSSNNVLQPVDVNIAEDVSPATKRVKYCDETENLPNWSLSDELKLHEGIDQGVEKLEPESDNNDCVFQSNEKFDYCDDNSKAASSYQYHSSSSSAEKLNLKEWCSMLVKSPPINTPKINYFDMLSDEVILQIFHWIPKRHLTNVALACKRFHRLTQDESLWPRIDCSNRQLKPGCLGQILGKQVVILRLARSEICHPPFFQNQPVSLPDFKCRLLFLDLSMSFISTESLKMLFNKCHRLKKLSLEHVPVDNEVLETISNNKELEVVNFAMCIGIKEPGLQYLLKNCRKIRELNIAWTYLNQATITYLCNNLPSSLDRLNLSGCRKLINDEDIGALVNSCPNLRELDLSDCTALTGEAVKQITALEDLNFLALSRCYAISYRSLLLLRKMLSLSFLDVHGGYIDEEELNVVQEGLGARVNINKFKFSSIARPTVGLRRSSIWNMRVRE